MLSTLQVSDGLVVVRLCVSDTYGHEQRTYCVTMRQRLGGAWDGFWYTQAWVAEDMDLRALRAD